MAHFRQFYLKASGEEKVFIGPKVTDENGKVEAKKLTKALNSVTPELVYSKLANCQADWNKENKIKNTNELKKIFRMT